VPGVHRDFGERVAGSGMPSRFMAGNHHGDHCVVAQKDAPSRSKKEKKKEAIMNRGAVPARCPYYSLSLSSWKA
jgi:hypothetical protein